MPFCDTPTVMAGKESKDSLLLLEPKEEGELPEALKKNLLLEVFIYLFLFQSSACFFTATIHF